MRLFTGTELCARSIRVAAKIASPIVYAAVSSQLQKSWYVLVPPVTKMIRDLVSDQEMKGAATLDDDPFGIPSTSH